MPLSFRCPSGHPLAAADDRRGEVVHCPQCGQPVIVPQRSAPTNAEPAADVTGAGEPPKPTPPVYRPDAGHLTSLRWLSLMLGLCVAFSLLPLTRTGGLDLESGPGWARAVALMAALQAAYLLWMLAVPDFSSVWVVMLVFAGVSAVYALATALTLAAPPDKPLPFSLGDVRETAGTWCAAVLGLSALGTYLAGRLSTRWRNAAEIWNRA